MSIGFAFTAQAVQPSAFLAAVEALAEQRGDAVQCEEAAAWVTLAPMGVLYLELAADGAVSGECQTTPAGPGLHKAALAFVRALAETAMTELVIDDETDYAVHGDFERLQEEHFYAWLSNLVRIGADYESAPERYSNICFCWDTAQYQPEAVPGAVVTPLGRFDLAKMAALTAQEGIAALAERFFVWDHEEKDALYHRNKALNGLWEHCYFRPSSRSSEDQYINRVILDELEFAMALDPALPEPLAEYEELCALAGRSPRSVAGIPLLDSDFPIGFRKGQVLHRFGELTLCLPGSYQYDTEERAGGGTDHLWYDDTAAIWWRVTGFGFEEPVTDFLGNIFAGTEDVRTVDIGQGGQVRMGYAGALDEDGEIYYQIVAQAISGHQVTLITVSFDRPEDRGAIFKQLSRMRSAANETIEERTDAYSAPEGEDGHGEETAQEV